MRVEFLESAESKFRKLSEMYNLPKTSLDEKLKKMSKNVERIQQWYLSGKSDTPSNEDKIYASHSRLCDQLHDYSNSGTRSPLASLANFQKSIKSMY